MIKIVLTNHNLPEKIAKLSSLVSEGECQITDINEDGNVTEFSVTCYQVHNSEDGLVRTVSQDHLSALFDDLIQYDFPPVEVSTELVMKLQKRLPSVANHIDVLDDAVLNASIETPIEELQKLESQYQLYKAIQDNIYRLSKGQVC